MVYVLHLDVRQAIPISLIVIAAASAVGVIPKLHARQVQWRLAVVFALAGVPATFVGSALGERLPQRAVLLGFAAVMVIAALRVLADHADTGTA